MCIEFLQDNVAEALDLYHRGSDLLCSADSNTLESSVAPVFWHFSTIAIVSGVASLESNCTPQFNASDTGSKLKASEAAMYHLVRECKASQHATCSENQPPLAVLQAEAQSLQVRLSAWLANHQALNISKDSGASQDRIFSSIKLLQAHAGMLIALSTCLDPSEMAFDACLDLFEQIVSYGHIDIEATKLSDGSQPTFVLESSIRLSLYMAATKCRNHQLRHEALSLLRQSPPLQGLIKSLPYATIAAKVIELEEGRYISASPENTKLLELGEYLPEQYRVRDHIYSARIGNEGRALQFINCTWCRQDKDGTWRTIKEPVPL